MRDPQRLKAKIKRRMAYRSFLEENGLMGDDKFSNEKLKKIFNESVVRFFLDKLDDHDLRKITRAIDDKLDYQKEKNTFFLFVLNDPRNRDYKILDAYFRDVLLYDGAEYDYQADLSSQFADEDVKKIWRNEIDSFIGKHRLQGIGKNEEEIKKVLWHIVRMQIQSPKKLRFLAYDIFHTASKTFELDWGDINESEDSDLFEIYEYFVDFDFYDGFISLEDPVVRSFLKDNSY